ncbi:MAG TPA: hypothetical protein VF384_05600 [Planctomycetota bacterium]
MNRVNFARLFSLAIIVAFASCSGSSNGVGGIKTGGDFIVLQTEPSDNGALFLNDAISIDFSNPVSLESASLLTFSFQVLDQIGNTVAEPVAGHFEIGTSPGDSPTALGRRLKFVPRLPTNDLYTNGGFRPGRTYVVQLVGGNPVNGTVLRDNNGKGLRDAVSFRFTTSDGVTPGQLFRNPAAGGPRRASFEFEPKDSSGLVYLNKLGAPPVEIRLAFDQPLNPSSANVPTAVETNPLTRSSNAKGRIFLEYKDPEYDPSPDDYTWIPADVTIDQETVSVVTLRPLGVLPNNATIRVIVERTLEDISGESNTSNPAYDPVFGTFRTQRSYEQQFDALVDDFLTTDNFDLAAAFAQPVAEVGPGYVKAGFAFEGTTTGAEFEPTLPETVLNTNLTLVQPKVGSAYNVSGGVFNFKNVKINPGKNVKGTGSNPMVWLVSGSFEVGGSLSVDGGQGTRVDSSGNADVPKPGGAGVCGGGDGGRGSPSSTVRDIVGETGNGPLQAPLGGGTGGSLACAAGCTRGAGGGGGSMSTQGDPNYKRQAIAPTPPTTVFPIFQQVNGAGGNGCNGAAGVTTRSLLGGIPGPIVFVDSRADNNYWGGGYNVNAGLRITGELSVPIGGGGGGGGGDLSYNSDCNTNVPNFENDSSGGGGGGGGGVLVVKALGPITVLETGRITANGGHGGGGEQQGSCNKGGGGGGGAGGMVVLMSATSINIHAKGPGNAYLYAASPAPGNDYGFSISADGGICTTLTFPLPSPGSPNSPIVQSKYPTTSGVLPPANFPNTYDGAPLGAFGGMGIVQLMAPPGPLPAGISPDQTNTILDDNIKVFRSGLQLSGTQKQAVLAWRGFPNAQGQGVDDAGNVILPPNPTLPNDYEGDIRPAPVLLPSPFAEKSRLRSYWIDTGASKRRPLFADDNLPRGIIDPQQDLRGPRYEFAGVDAATGYLSYAVANGLARVTYPEVVPLTTITGTGPATYQGEPAYFVRTAGAFGTTIDRHSQYEAELRDTNNLLVGSFRILANTENEITVSAESGALPTTATKVRVLAKFFKVVTSGSEGLGQTYPGSTAGTRVPVANVRIGFAFHQDPANPTAQRWPALPNTFEYDLANPAVQESIRALGAAFVQWDILFDMRFKVAALDDPPALKPDSPRPELHFLRLPFRF